MNMIYNNPIVENNLIEPSAFMCSGPIKPNPCGPIITPDIINPIIAGILIFLRIIGDNKIINNNNENTRTGFFKGR